MSETSAESATRQFYDFELQGRGWKSYEEPVALEPAFRPFAGYTRISERIDDARNPTVASRLVERFFKPAKSPAPEPQHKPRVRQRQGHSCNLEEWEVLVPEDEKIDSATSEAWIRAASASSGPMVFELVGEAGRVSIRLATPSTNSSSFCSQFQGLFPRSTIRRPARSIAEAWAGGEGELVGAVELGLAREFVIPLRMPEGAPDPLAMFVGALALARHSEVALVQLMFEPVTDPWATSALQASRSPDGEPFFADAPWITDLTEDKCSEPLFAVIARIAIRAGSEEQIASILQGLISAFSQFGNPDRNEFIPLALEDRDQLIDDILARVTRRSGMILSLPELTSIVRVPSPSLRTPSLIRQDEPEFRLPAEVLGDQGTTLGTGIHKERRVPVRISHEGRLQHTYIIGASGTGKSTLLTRMILEDIEQGAGVAVLDPHGDLIDELLTRIPNNRVDDVVLFDPGDTRSRVGWNILEAHSDVEKNLLASDLVGVFQRLSTSWGDQMSVVLGNAVMAFLESRCGGTLADLRAFLLDEEYRREFLQTVTDSHVALFWKKEWPLLVGKRPQAPILTRLDILLRSKLVRQAVTRTDNSINFRNLIDGGKIFLGKLSQGAIGDDNAALLGSLLVSKFHQVALSRQTVPVEERRPFHLFIDEFHQIVTPSMGSLFSGLRKYRMSVTVAHHDLYQLHSSAPDVERAVLTNTYTRIFFRVSDEDARRLERTTGDFTANDLTNLPRGEAICRVERDDQTFRLQTEPLAPLSTEQAAANRARFAIDPLPVTPPAAAEEIAVSPNLKQQTPPATPSKRAEAAPVEPVPRLGRGGAIHKYLQGVVAEWARSAGFTVAIEHQLPDKSRVDVALFRDTLSIACEIAGVTTVEQEIANLKKSLDAGFSAVIEVSLDAKFLRRLQESVDQKFSEDVRKKVTLCAPEEMLSILSTYEIAKPETRVAGYKVRVRHQSADGATDEEQRRAVADVMLKSIKRMRESKQ